MAIIPQLRDKIKRDGLGILNNSSLPKLSAGLFLFYLALLGNYTGDLLAPSIIKAINNNRYIQHLISFLILLFTVNLYNEKSSFGEVFMYCLGLWIWYILTSKQGIYSSSGILALLMISYVFLNLKTDLNKDIHKISDLQKKRLHLTYTKLQNICFFTILIVSIIGGGLYFDEHYKQYRSKSKTFLEFLFKYFMLGSHKK